MEEEIQGEFQGDGEDGAGDEEAGLVSIAQDTGIQHDV